MTPLLSRLAALGLLLAGVALVTFAALPVWDAATARREEIADLRAQLARFRDEIRTASRAPGIDVADAALFEAGSEAVAAARLRDILDAAARAAGARLETFQIEDSVPLEATGLVAIPVTLALETDMENLVAFLHRIETGTPYLFVERLDLRRLRRSDDPRVPTAVGLRLRVQGLMPAPSPG
ncbi:MAG: type II secretion system protein GspM [Paracoccaceae bacterium]